MLINLLHKALIKMEGCWCRIKGEYIFFTSILFCVVLTGYCLFICVPEINRERENLQEEINVVQQDVNKADKFRQEHSNYEVYEKNLTMKNDMFKGKIPEKIAIGSFMENISKAANREQLNIVKLEPNAISTEENYTSQSVDLELQGSYFQIIDFFRDLEKEKTFIGVDKVHISSQENIIRCNVTLKIYAAAD